MSKHHINTHTSFIPILALKLGSHNNQDKILHKNKKTVRNIKNRTVLKRQNHNILSYKVITEHQINTHKPQVKAKINFLAKPMKFIAYFKKLSSKDKLKWIGFFAIALICLINIPYMTLRFIDNKYEYHIFSYANIEAILPGQEIPGTISTSVVLLRKLDIDKLQVGDQVVICCDFGQPDTYWVEYVVAINKANNEIEVSYNMLFVTTVAPDEIYGVYDRTSGFFGTMYYTSTFARGYLMLTMSHLIVFYGYFYIVLKKRKDKLFGF